MKLHFIFPADVINSKLMDEFYMPQADVLAPYSYSLFSAEEMKVRGEIPAGSTVVYRGWMLSESEYTLLNHLVEKKGGQMLTSPQRYVNTHYLPNWYPHLSDLTMETVILPAAGVDYVAELKKLNWPRYFIKDYVKSLKTGIGSLIENPENVTKVLQQMELYRGTIEGGVCVRKYENLHDEQRYFVFNGEVHGEYRDGDVDVLDKVVRRIDSPFFSVDVAYNEDGRTRVVEVGDGQVSDLVGWTPEGFTRVFKV